MKHAVASGVLGMRRGVSAITLAVLVAACGGDGEEGSTPGTAPPVGGGLPAPSPAASPAPVPTATPSASPAPTPAPSPGTTPAPTPTATATPVPPPVSGKGLFECPAVEPPAYAASTGGTPAGKLSTGYQSSCATCHGATGQGLGVFPAIPGTMSEADFIRKARTASAVMPAHDASFISDAELKSDYAILKKLVGVPATAAMLAPGAAAWTVAKTEEVYQSGLAVWRKASAKDGTACTHCHAPDAIDLALIGFSDDAIMRRANLHIDVKDALVLRDFVHAQRKRFAVGKPCATDWRPFQPGGTVLPGKNASEQDISFRDELVKRNVQVMTSRIVTLADAQRAVADLQAIDLRKLPIGIPLPRWTEDPFNGPAHKTLNDYMPGLPAVPNNPADFAAKEDAYLANPTDDGLFKLLDMFSKETTDGGFMAQVPGDPACSPGKTTSMTAAMRDFKRRSNLIGQHLFRQALLKREGWVDKPRSPFPNAPFIANPMFFMGGENVEPFLAWRCNIDYRSAPLPGLVRATPPSDREQLSAKDAADGRMTDLSAELSHPWMTLGQIFDQTLFSTEPQAENKLGYWANRNFIQRDFHAPFFYAHRTATQAKYWTDYRNTSLYPKSRGYHGGISTHPFLDGPTLFQTPLGIAQVDVRVVLDPVGAARFRGNLIRMFLLVQRDLLLKGAPVNEPGGFASGCTGVGCQVDSWYQYIRDLKGTLGNPDGRATMAGFTQQDIDLYVTDTEKLMTEVLGLIAKAPTVN
ncbi:MAG: c-type cytochrome [Burkholderiaceae bacterium]